MQERDPSRFTKFNLVSQSLLCFSREVWKGMAQELAKRNAKANGETNGFKVIGQSTKRVDALEKVTGRALYAADLTPPGMLWGVFVRSPHPHALIKQIDISKAEKLPGVMAVVTQDTLAGSKTGRAYWTLFGTKQD